MTIARREEKWGCEDPRMNKVENEIYMAYTGKALKNLRILSLTRRLERYPVFQRM